MSKLSIGMIGLIVVVCCIAGGVVLRDSSPTADPQVEHKPSASPSKRKPDPPPAGPTRHACQVCRIPSPCPTTPAADGRNLN